MPELFHTCIYESEDLFLPVVWALGILRIFIVSLLSLRNIWHCFWTQPSDSCLLHVTCQTRLSTLTVSVQQGSGKQRSVREERQERGGGIQLTASAGDPQGAGEQAQPGDLTDGTMRGRRGGCHCAQPLSACRWCVSVVFVRMLSHSHSPGTTEHYRGTSKRGVYVLIRWYGWEGRKEPCSFFQLCSLWRYLVLLLFCFLSVYWLIPKHEVQLRCRGTQARWQPQDRGRLVLSPNRQSQDPSLKTMLCAGRFKSPFWKHIFCCFCMGRALSRSCLLGSLRIILSRSIWYKHFSLIISEPLAPLACVVDVNRSERQKIKSDPASLGFSHTRGCNAAG